MADNIQSILKETRQFVPDPSFSAGARIGNADDYDQLWRESVESPETFWPNQARQLLSWDREWHQLVEDPRPHGNFRTRWFVGGRLNASVNCLDRHLEKRGEKAAIIWHSETGDERRLSYSQLHEQVCRLAQGLKNQGIAAGDVVAIYMPLVPELVISMLACARIGAVHNVIFAGFSSKAIAQRCCDSEAKLIITADGVRRRGQVIPLRSTVTEALDSAPSVKQVIVFPNIDRELSLQSPEILWQDVVAGSDWQAPVESFDADHPLFTLYTSGSTGKPKGIIHSTAGYLLQARLSYEVVFDHKEDDIYWCTADCGWITGHSYLTYGPLAAGATVFIYEGAPNYPDWNVFWRLIEKYRVTKFYTAPTAIRSFIQNSSDGPSQYDLSSLRLLGSVGEPINPEAWRWYYEKVGRGKCPIVDTWWQTETGSIMITTAPGCMAMKPGSAGRPFLGVDASVVDSSGQPVPCGQGGILVLKRSWPGICRTIAGDHQRYLQTYFREIDGVYYTGDGARVDSDGYFWILGRIDDVINTSGHRLSTMEIESALVSHDSVAEAAVVGKTDPTRGEVIACFVVPQAGVTGDRNLYQSLVEHVVKEIGALARPEELRFTDRLPKTRSGKIMRRLLRDIVEGRPSAGDTTTLEDRTVVDGLREGTAFERGKSSS